MTLTFTSACHTCGATPDAFPERTFWTWPHSDDTLAKIFRPAGTSACSACWGSPVDPPVRPLYDVLHEVTPWDPRPIYGPVRRSRGEDTRDWACPHPGPHSPHCSDCWIATFCYECGQENTGNHASCFVSMMEVEGKQHAEDAHSAYCEDQPPHGISQCKTYGYDYPDGIYLR